MRDPGQFRVLDDPRDADAPGAPIGALIGNAASELRSLCAAAYEVEAAVGALVDRSDPAALAELRGLQELDRLIQHIDGLAVYLSELARSAEGLGQVDARPARRTIKLERLAAALDGKAHVRAVPIDDGFELL